MSKKIPTRILLTQSQMPQQYYNVRADMHESLEPYINPGSMLPAKAEDLYPVFAQELCEQEMTEQRYVDIPEEVQRLYHIYRPSPVIRAYNLEKALDTPARIYYKYEGNNTSGSHKLNSAIAQVYYNKIQGITNITTETGAGQWGTALAMATANLGVDLTVYMVKGSYEQKPYRRAVMETYGAKVYASPSATTNVGREILQKDPENRGSLGTAISEAMEVALNTPNSRYSLGSVLNQVLLHQSIIGLEAKKQLEMVDEYPDYVIGCAGGGSNLGGLMSAFMQDKLTGKQSPYFIAVEPEACPSLTRGKYAYDFADVGHITPLIKMYTLGNGFMPAGIHAGGLRFHAMSPIISKLYHDGFIDEARSVFQKDVFAAALLFAQQETILPAPESSHAIRAAIDVALECKESGEAKTILFGLTGSGNYDLAAYQQYLDGAMVDYRPTDEELQKGFDTIPQQPEESKCKAV
ncbi:TrpB-like pyridoxal phosphate-dependent enzyme [Clostridia bacterium OttesenSCG-928-F22]|nr:TrpB-like pyridoxal phosphate-dependent enzyme [Clostridia bacterium OttesenSCG-928-F22]